MSLNKKIFVFHLFLRLAGTKVQGEDRAGLLSFNFKYIPKTEQLEFPFSLEVALPSLGGENQLKALPWWMWDGGRNTFIFFICLFLPVRP